MNKLHLPQHPPSIATSGSKSRKSSKQYLFDSISLALAIPETCHLQALEEVSFPTTPIFQRRDMFPADRQTSPGAQKNPEFQSRLSVMDIDEGLGVRMADPWLAKQGSCSGWGARDFRRTGELDICVLFHGKALCKHHGNSWSPLLSGLSGWKEDQDVSCASLS